MGNERYQVLLVEDSEDDRDVCTHFLSIRGFRVATAVSGREGLEKAVQLQPDVILLDLWLPEIGGWEAAKRLKADERAKHIPIIIITGHSYIQADVLSSEGLLVKPCLPNDLEDEILRVLQTRRSSAAEQPKPDQASAA